MRAEGERPLERLDARLRRVGEWLLVGYTVALLLVTFGETGRSIEPAPGANVEPVAVMVG